VTAEQIDRVARHVVAARECDSALVRMVDARLRDDGFVIVRCALPSRIGRNAARTRIARLFADIACAAPRPGVLFVSGGETMRGLLAPLGARGLKLIGEHRPGAPISRIVGGGWDGLSVVSKSGAFGRPDFLLSLRASALRRRRVLSA
jgi:D-threonate/D-erythronate kinase